MTLSDDTRRADKATVTPGDDGDSVELLTPLDASLGAVVSISPIEVEHAGPADGFRKRQTVVYERGQIVTTVEEPPDAGKIIEALERLDREGA